MRRNMKTRDHLLFGMISRRESVDESGVLGSEQRNADTDSESKRSIHIITHENPFINALHRCIQLQSKRQKKERILQEHGISVLLS